MSVFGVWLGGGQPSPLAEQCMDTWPEDAKLWCGRAQLSSVIPDVSSIPYFKSAYDAGHWAGASDVARLMLLWELGGTYLDVDVQVLKPELLAELEVQALRDGRLIVGREDEKFMCNAVMIAPPKHPVIGALLERYKRTRFEDTFEGSTTGATMLTDAVNQGEKGATTQVMPPWTFYPWHWRDKESRNGSGQIDERAITAHHWEGSWVTKK